MSIDKKIPVGISARHVHITREHLDILYGPGYQLTFKKALGQPGQFAAEEVVDLVSEKGTFPKVRILGPERKQSQVEISLSDALKLKIAPPVRDSGDINGSAPIRLVGPKGQLELREGVIVAARHIHMTPADAAEFGVEDRQIVKVKCEGTRGLIFDNVLIRVSEQSLLEMHVDTDEGNAAMIKTGDFITIIK
ncbi:Phosphate propanoyltransferase [Propionispora sp. 2/2-37]|uniref:phosphate propanoyltransferase n=1 Tax=Propionispora sp. 2/2-37 TaxID=1677858 RepID=UPI0006BB7082|nr:phosphate propanoyltransferase [Propionispora sp. 2/2-37]CUH94254.1 Phosphate propanoyltransferase [Propionispora sp. 2/2-37]